MTLNQASISWAVRHCLQTSTSLEQATEVLTAYGLDVGKIAGLVGELDRGAGFVWQGRGAEALTLDGEASGRDVSRLLTTGTTPHGESIAGRAASAEPKTRTGSHARAMAPGAAQGLTGSLGPRTKPSRSSLPTRTIECAKQPSSPMLLPTPHISPPLSVLFVVDQAGMGS